MLEMCVFVDFIHKITVQASPALEKRRNSPDLGPGSSPSFGPRFRAIQREWTHATGVFTVFTVFLTNRRQRGLQPAIMYACEPSRFWFQLLSCSRSGLLSSPPRFPVGLLFSSLPALSLTHTLFPFYSRFQSKYYLTSSQQFSTFFPVRGPPALSVGS